MGVQGLMKFLDGAASLDLPNETIPQGSVFYVDGCGFCLEIMRKLDASYAHKVPLCSILSGLYADFDAVIRKEVKHLNETLGMQLIVCMDGRISRMKDATAESRMRDRENDWVNLLNVCMDGNYNIKNPRLPFPRMCMQQFQSTLLDMHIQVIQCDEEADQFIAMSVAAFNRSNAQLNKQAYCYGRDSDYVVFQDCPYIAIDSVFIEASCVQACVYRRSAIASDLGMTETQFMDLCILMGNDYTKHLIGTDFIASFSFTIERDDDYDDEEYNYNTATIEHLIQCVQSNVAPITSTNADYQVAVDFSRSLYHLQDISHYPIDTFEADEANRLSMADKSHFKSWIGSREITVPQDSPAGYMGTIVLEYLQEHLSRYGRVDGMHIEALQCMLNELSFGDESTGSTLATTPLDAVFRILRWEGTVTSLYFTSL